MKKIVFAGFVLCGFLLVAGCGKESAENGGPIEGPPQEGFVHPGMLDTKASLDFIRNKATMGEEPWASAFRQMKYSDYAVLSYQPRPFQKIHSTSYNEINIGGEEFYFDGQCAYTHALMWYITRDMQYAQKAIEIINAWSHTLTEFEGSNTCLKIGVAGIKYLNAAEIIKHTYTGWAEADQQAFGDMALNLWYELIKDFKPTTNGNWDAAIGQTMMCIGIFLDDEDIFNRAVNHLSTGRSLGAINHYFLPTGQCQESGRDYGHVQMGISYLSCACEVAWNQGVDMYSLYENRVMTGFEHASKWMLGYDVPYEYYTDFNGTARYHNPISEDGRGSYKPIYERVYNHYKNRKGIDMPYTWSVVVRQRNEGGGHDGYMPWVTLTCAKSMVPGSVTSWTNLDMTKWSKTGSEYNPLPDGYVSRTGHSGYFSRSAQTFATSPAIQMTFASSSGIASFFTTPYVSLLPGTYEVNFYLKGTGFIRSVTLCTSDVPEDTRRSWSSGSATGTMIAYRPMGNTVAAQKIPEWTMYRALFEVTQSGSYSLNFNHNNRNETNTAADPSDPLLISHISVKKLSGIY